MRRFIAALKTVWATMFCGLQVFFLKVSLGSVKKIGDMSRSSSLVTLIRDDLYIERPKYTHLRQT